MGISFSIITPCLNGAATIGQALDSVRRQEFPEVEHIVVDGGSTDATMEIVQAAGAHVRAISEPDRGLSDAMNKGVAMAGNDVIGWLNADDVYLPGALRRVADAFERNPQAIWATGHCLIIDGDGREIRRGITRYKNALLRRWSFQLFLTQNFVSSPATFVRRDALLELGGFEERFRYSMDYDLWLKLARRAAPIVIDAPVACFRMAEGSLSMTGFERQFHEHMQNAREHGKDHPVAVAANVVMSHLIVIAYRAMRAVRKRQLRTRR